MCIRDRYRSTTAVVVVDQRCISYIRGDLIKELHMRTITAALITWLFVKETIHLSITVRSPLG